MEVKSRVKKYEDLRRTVEGEGTTLPEDSNDLNEYKNVAVHAPKEKEEYEPVHQKSASNEHLVEATGEFKNEYLDSFIQEVRDYNIKKGVRENEDTRLDILQQLSTKQREKRASFMEQMEVENEPIIDPQPTFEEIQKEIMENHEVEAPKQVLDATPYYQEDEVASTSEIARQVQELLQQNEEEFHADSEIHEPVVEDEYEVVESTKHDDTTENKYTNDQLFEETLKLKVQLDEYEEELTSLNSGVDKNNKLLNIIISVLIFMLLAVVGVVVYWLISGGVLS